MDSSSYHIRKYPEPTTYRFMCHGEGGYRWHMPPLHGSNLLRQTYPPKTVSSNQLLAQPSALRSAIFFKYPLSKNEGCSEGRASNLR